jgi:pyruvate dehydrogenase E2 component (dihydrolipoamide acetyltransferase)
MSNDTYAALAAGDPLALAACHIPPRIVARAAAARKARASLPSPAARAPQAPASIAAPAPAAAPRPSRAALVAEAHLAAINASRKKCGLAPLSASELATEFAELDRLPTNTTTKKSARRAAANAMAARQGLPTDQAAIDSRWAASAQKLNASLPSSRTPIGAARTSSAGGAKPSQGDIDARWSEIVTKLNAEAGLATPVGDRAR